MTFDLAALIAAAERAIAQARWPGAELVGVMRGDLRVLYRCKREIPPRTPVVLSNDGYVRKPTKRDAPDDVLGMTISDEDYIEQLVLFHPTPTLERADMDEHTYRQRAADEVEAWYRRQVALGLADREHAGLVAELVQQMRTGRLVGWK